MALKAINPTKTKAWEKLSSHFEEIKDVHMVELFRKNPERAKEMAIEWNDFYVDYSKNRINKETLDLLVSLAEELDLQDAISKYFSGDTINETEGRAVLHTALRAGKDDEVLVDGVNVVPEVYQVREKISQFSDSVINGSRKGYTGKAFTHVVNIGIGGSDLGPAMVTEALAYYKNHLDVRFISNVDGDHVMESLKGLDPETTLFVVVSKTFTTQETLSNATTAKNWFLKTASEKDVAKHFVAVSTNLEKIADFGIHADNVFPMWDWVGGRFSLWSAVGLSIALSVGYENYAKLLDGARAMDQHFKETPFERNIPVVLSLINIWYNNFFDAESEAIIPYTQYLHRFSAYLQQGIMESNGKSIDRNGQRVGYQTGTIIWGEPGTNSQHAFFQLIHQGTKLIPADFIGFTESLHGEEDHHKKLMSNFFAQTEALLNGKVEDVVIGELKAQGKNEEQIKALTPFKIFEGNKPTNTFMIDRLTPQSLGALIALYEHKIFVQGVVWNIFSYDQWGVELGKQLANNILKDFAGETTAEHDPSTALLIKRFMEH
ncbi:glucose-6-phosphate isomerase [Robertkochia marina]|uniref:Glucose-6-phosphate isomerase n=1 Tax=Robertkochia marina TaxID=1227945 RepID=A0A4S3M371_9FLAO|nr:glucose-6-phosphate isomerase [Robertkochia marina]THD69513.1 glucose-6-phosphate isomerase [Robertkochia marina]TRZ47228.1 glucose-6-phosphate isomerase [Robertkochia marina]